MLRYLAALLALLWALPALAAQKADLIIRHVTLIDVEHSRAVPDQAIATRGGDIVAAGPDGAVARDWTAARSIDGRGRYAIPGLWDMHVHFGGGPDLLDENKALLPIYIANGITSIRDCAGDIPYDVLRWRGEIRDGSLFGPTLYTSGPKIEGINPVWKGTLETGSRADVDAALAKLQSLGVDFVKITDSTLKPDLFLYAVARAKALGLRTSAHIPMAVTVEQAVAAGLSSIEHLDYALLPGSPQEAAISAEFAAGRIDRAEAHRRLRASFDTDTAMRAWRDFAARGLAVTPTLNGSRIIVGLASDDHSKDAGLAYIGPKLRKTYDWRIQRAASATPEQTAERRADFDKAASTLPLIAKAGLPIMAGTDAGFLNSFNYPGSGLHDELELYVARGLTPAQALTSATRTGPIWLGKGDRYGALAAGKAADIVLLRANPLDDIAATRAIDTVVLRGTVHDRAALDRMLADARAQVAAWNAAESAH